MSHSVSPLLTTYWPGWLDCKTGEDAGEAGAGAGAVVTVGAGAGAVVSITGRAGVDSGCPLHKAHELNSNAEVKVEMRRLCIIINFPGGIIMMAP